MPNAALSATHSGSRPFTVMMIITHQILVRSAYNVCDLLERSLWFFGSLSLSLSFSLALWLLDAAEMPSEPFRCTWITLPIIFNFKPLFFITVLGRAIYLTPYTIAIALTALTGRSDWGDWLKRLAEATALTNNQWLWWLTTAINFGNRLQKSTMAIELGSRLQ